MGILFRAAGPIYPSIGSVFRMLLGRRLFEKYWVYVAVLINSPLDKGSLQINASSHIHCGFSVKRSFELSKFCSGIFMGSVIYVEIPMRWRDAIWACFPDVDVERRHLSEGSVLWMMLGVFSVSHRISMFRIYGRPSNPCYSLENYCRPHPIL